jgi:D-arabinose 1-dehydrogenase-like Zn-dependent alcohol dehydrogenase
MKKLAIIGASGHGKAVADIAVKVGYEEILFLDDNEEKMRELSCERGEQYCGET